MRQRYLCLLLVGMLAGCSTLEQSLELGGGMGAIAGASAVYAGAEATTGKAPSLETIAISAGIGTVVGLVTSYYTHKSVEVDRQSCQSDQIEMHFGDLPPSPFIVPTKKPAKKGEK